MKNVRTVDNCGYLEERDVDINSLQAKILIEESVKPGGGLCHIEIGHMVRGKEVREENPREKFIENRGNKKKKKGFHSR